LNQAIDSPWIDILLCSRFAALIFPTLCGKVWYGSSLSDCNPTFIGLGGSRASQGQGQCQNAHACPYLYLKYVLPAGPISTSFFVESLINQSTLTTVIPNPPCFLKGGGVEVIVGFLLAFLFHNVCNVHAHVSLEVPFWICTVTATYNTYIFNSLTDRFAEGCSTIYIYKIKRLVYCYVEPIH